MLDRLRKRAACFKPRIVRELNLTGGRRKWGPLRVRGRWASRSQSHGAKRERTRKNDNVSVLFDHFSCVVVMRSVKWSKRAAITGVSGDVCGRP